MKSVFIAVAALLPALALAAPVVEARQEGKRDVLACACANDAGQTYVPSVCLAYAGSYHEVDGQEYCVPRATWSERMDEAFTDANCPQYNAEFPKQACKTVSVCPLIGDYTTPC